MNQQSTTHLLRHYGYRSTPQRHIILQALEPEQTHLTVEQILARTRESCPSMPLSTIYRTLELLLQLDLVRVTHVAGHPPYYERVTGSAHYHLLCRRCLALIHLDANMLGKLNGSLEQDRVFWQIREAVVS